MAFKKQFTCGCDAPNCNKEETIWATSQLAALRELIARKWNVVSKFPNLPTCEYMYCPDHYDFKY